MWKKILLGVGVVLGILLVVIALQPSSYKIERTTVIDAPPAAVFPHVADFAAFKTWSPWEGVDPNLKTTITGAPATVGHKYAWKGNADAGEGEMTVVAISAPERVDIDLKFLAPFASEAKTHFLLVPEGEKTKVTWGMNGGNDFMGKAFGMLMDMEGMIGADYDKGLKALKASVEKEAAAAAAKAEAAKAEAAEKEAAEKEAAENEATEKGAEEATEGDAAQ